MTASALLGLLGQPPTSSAVIIFCVGQIMSIFVWRLFRFVELHIYLKFLGEQAEQAHRTKDPHRLRDLARAMKAFPPAWRSHDKPRGNLPK